MTDPNHLLRSVALCSSCHLPFTCGMRETSEPCWCAALPRLSAIETGQDCLCPACLREHLAAQPEAIAGATPDVR